MRSDLTGLDKFKLREANGQAIYRFPFREGIELQVIASELFDWDHLSVVALLETKERPLKYRKGGRETKIEMRKPTLDELADVRRRFFADGELVVSYVMPESVNEFVHLWRPGGEREFPFPKDYGMPKPVTFVPKEVLQWAAENGDNQQVPEA